MNNTAKLPYAFDTGDVARKLIPGLSSLTAIVVGFGLIKFLFVVPSIPAALGIIVIGGMLSAFCYIIIKKLGGASGTISHSEIVVTPHVFFGIASDSAAGTFAITRFQSLLVEEMLWAAQRYSPHERVSLVSKDQALDILIARTQRGAGLTLARELGALLNLRVEEKQMPY